MATTAEFTEQELETMHKGAAGAGLLVSLSDRSFFDTFKEAGALGRHLAGARQNQTSEVVREIAQRSGTGFGIGSSPDEVERETVEALRSSIATLEQRAPEEANAYREFVLEVAESVASAAGGGETVETQTLEKIRSALGTSAAR